MHMTIASSKDNAFWYSGVKLYETMTIDGVGSDIVDVLRCIASYIQRHLASTKHLSRRAVGCFRASFEGYIASRLLAHIHGLRQ